MRLKRLEIYGFKSFPQRTEIVFNQGITGIVGPNGSGKSNIGDAVRWVLGEQSARTLRGAKMEDVIFGGTQKRKSMAFCEVTLAFDNEDGSLPLPFAEVAVTRRVFRSGEGEYMINQAPCRLKDMIDLFRDTGIGREGYSLIGQGRIDEILSLKSEDRRQVFEEAAGISRFRARKVEAERSLDRTRDNLARADDILKEIEDRLEPLGKQADQAREYLELTGELKTLDLNLFLIGYERVSQRIAGLKAASGEAQDAMLRVEAAIRERVRERDESAETAARLDSEAENARAALADAQTRLADAKSTRERLSERVTGADEQKTRLAAELDAALEDVALRDQASGSDQHALDECLERVAEAEKSLAKAEHILQEAIESADALSAELDSHREGVLRAVNRLSDLNAARARSETMLTQIAARQDEFTRALSDLENGRSALKNAYDSAREALENTRTQAASFRAVVEDAQKQVKSLDEKARAHSEALQNKNAKLRGDESRLRLLSEMAASLEGYNQSVRRALSYSEHNPRVRGVLARLIRVPKQFEVAIDVALGGALQNIVTEDQETAKDLFEYLRQNKLGRVTCLPISAIRGRGLTPQERRLLSMPGCLGVASELIEYGEEYADIIESLLGRTVVARTLNEGIPIMNAGGRAFRLVTLEGDVMHSGGSMTGGGNGQSRAVSLLGRERETEELRASVDAQRSELLEGQKALQKLMQARDQAANVFARAQTDSHEEDIAVARDTAALERARDALGKHDEQIDMTKSALEQLSDSMNTIHSELEKLSQSSDDTALDRQAMEDKTQALARVLSEKRLEADTKRENVTRATLALGECQHAAQDQTRAAQKLLKEREAAHAHADALREELRAHDERTEMAIRALEEINHTVNDHEIARAQADEHVRDVENQRREVQKKNTDCTQAIETLHTESATHSDHQHRLQLSLSRAESDLESQCAYIHNTYLLTYADALPYRTQEKFDVAPSERRAGELRSRIRALGSVNVASIEEFAATKARYDDMISQREDMRKAEGDLEQLIHRLLSRMEKQFTEQFEILGKYFVETFTRLFGGGQAELKLADPDHALECGIDIVAQPPGKKLQMLSLLSGGERALTAIAILFAMLKLKPTPFCILDEIEAALDEANITYFADYLAEYAKTTQFVVITHRKGTMERCDALYGVAMQEQGVSGMVSVDLRDYE